jgi:hypothetical protein
MNAIVESPFSASTAVAQSDTAGARQSQARELAEVQTQYLMAERFPRNEVAATDRILTSFQRATLAEKAQYQFARGGSDISGPSIRAAEAIAQQWGNLDTGWREIQRGTDANGVSFSEVEAFCIDLQARNRKRLQFIVPHWRDTRQGGYKLKDERDIYELCANQAQRRLRACILASVPGDVTDAAMKQAEATLKATADTSPAAMQKMVELFSQFGITKEQIEKRIQRRMDAIQPAQVVSLRRIFTSLRDDMSEAKDWFDFGDADHEPAAPKGPQRKSSGAAPAATVPPPAEPPAQAQAPAAASTTLRASAGDAGPKISQGQATYLRGKLQAANRQEAEVCASYGAANLEALSVLQFDEIKADLLAWE